MPSCRRLCREPFLACGAGPTAALADTPAPAQAASASPAAVAPPASNEGANKKKTVEIDQFVVDGVHILSQEQVEDAVYEFLGPDRTAEDVEKARQALEKLYHDKGYQTVSVTIPPQQVEDGVVYLTVIENKVGRLRVKGAHYFSIDDIKAGAPSVAEGTVPNFNNISQDIFALNQQPDRRITPALRAGTEPGTVDVDLNVDDKLPIHGSVELNNRYSAHTVPLRLTSTVSDANLWQLGHTLSLTYQVAPQDASNSKVYSASYTAPVPGISWLSLLAYGLKNESNVAAVSGVDVVGRGYTLGARAIIALPGEQDFAHSLSVGFDYKHVDQFVNLSASTISSPVSVAPLSVTTTPRSSSCTSRASSTCARPTIPTRTRSPILAFLRERCERALAAGVGAIRSRSIRASSSARNRAPISRSSSASATCVRSAIRSSSPHRKSSSAAFSTAPPKSCSSRRSQPPRSASPPAPLSCASTTSPKPSSSRRCSPPLSKSNRERIPLAPAMPGTPTAGAQ